MRLQPLISILISGNAWIPIQPKEEVNSTFQLVNSIKQISAECKRNDAILRIIGEVTVCTDVDISRFASEENIELHVLSSGAPTGLPHQHGNPQRRVWLSAEDIDFVHGMPHTVRDEIAVCFSDFVLLVLDENGEPGDLSMGPGRIASMAAQAMKPVLLLDKRGQIRVLDRLLLTPDKLHLLQCQEPKPDWLWSCFSAPNHIENIGDDIAKIVNDILDEEDRSYSALSHINVGMLSRKGNLHKAMFAITRANFRKFRGAFASSALSPFRGPAWDDHGPVLLAPTPLLNEKYDRASVSATYAAGCHRDGTWIVYAAATTAVFSAVAGAIHLWPGGHGLFWSLIELLVVSIILLIVKQAKIKDWHGHWISQRFVAEQLRYFKMGLPFLVIPRSIMQPAWGVETNSQGQSSLVLQSKELWAIQRAVTQSGLPSLANSPDYVAALPVYQRVFRDYLLNVINDQINYHQQTWHEQHHANHTLHRLAMGLFGLTAVAVVAHLFVHASWLLVFTAFFPALAAGIHGLATKLEIARVAGQSEATVTRLTEVKSAIHLLEQDRDLGWSDWLALRHLASTAMRIMSDENDRWHQLIRHQEPELPA